jgi:hypothetical protein
LYPSNQSNLKECPARLILTIPLMFPYLLFGKKPALISNSSPTFSLDPKIGIEYESFS